jgi:hypothetical protein
MLRTSLLAVVLLALQGCGAETAAIATIGYIAPIGGDFTLDTDPSTPQLETGGIGEVINIQIGPAWDQFYDTKFEVTGTTNLADLGAACPEFTGLVDERSLTAFIPATGKVCFSAHFDNESTLVLSDGRRLLRNFPVTLDVGSWVNINDARQVFRFDTVTGTAFSGCELKGSSITPVAGEFIEADIRNGVLASIKFLTVQRASGAENYSGFFEGASGLRLKSGRSEILLQRQRGEPTCTAG